MALVSLQDQWQRFTAEVPAGEVPVLSRRHFAEWGERYLDSDPASRTRTPPSVKTPSGPWFDIGRAWAGDLAYDPSRVRAPVAIIRGEWDSMCTDKDAAWLFDALAASPIRRDVKISRGTHLMHLEKSRYALYRETQNFLAGGDEPARLEVTWRGTMFADRRLLGGAAAQRGAGAAAAARLAADLLAEGDRP